jgi:serine/threonine protein kinase
MLKTFSSAKHPHLIRLLATYQFKEQYHLLFPSAQSNLRKYWEQKRTPVCSIETILWLLRQINGIASALTVIHNYQQCTEKEGERRYGHHGDIKPENILWFNDLENSGSNGILQIADFGLGRLHGLESRSRVNPKTVATTPTYEAPEISLERPVSRAYDIWSLGCVFLEFATWLLKGEEGLYEFENARIQDTEGILEAKFFTLQQKSTDGKPIATVSPAIRECIMNLRNHRRSSPSIRDLLDIIELDMLVVNSRDRIRAAELVTRIQILVEKSVEDETYLLGCATQGARVEAQKGQSLGSVVQRLNSKVMNRASRVALSC